MLTYGSLFSGVGGLDLALDRTGMKCLWQVEKDLYARKILRKHWPRVPKWQDVTKVNSTHLPFVDVVVGGWPCQDLSVANPHGQGLAGPRSGLWSEYRRLVGEIRPRAVFIENGASSRKRWLGTILRDLAALRYDAEWHCIPAAYVGAPHIRDRCFVVAYAHGQWESQPYRGLGHQWDGVEYSREGSGGAREISDTEGARQQGYRAIADRSEFSRPICDGRVQSLGDGGAWGGADQPRLGGTADGLPGGLDGPGEDLNAWRDGWEDGVPRMLHGVPHRADRLKCLGNAVVNQAAQILARRIRATLEAQPAR